MICTLYLLHFLFSLVEGGREHTNRVWQYLSPHYEKKNLDVILEHIYLGDVLANVLGHSQTLPQTSDAMEFTCLFSSSLFKILIRLDRMYEIENLNMENSQKTRDSNSEIYNNINFEI